MLRKWIVQGLAVAAVLVAVIGAIVAGMSKQDVPEEPVTQADTTSYANVF